MSVDARVTTLTFMTFMAFIVFIDLRFMAFIAFKVFIGFELRRLMTAVAALPAGRLGVFAPAMVCLRWLDLELEYEPM